MIGVFADPYPDELFYSICARTCKRAGYPSYRSALLDLIGCEAVLTNVAFPSHLDDLVARLPQNSGYTSDSLIAEHTLLPFFHPFLPPERSARLRLDMCRQKGLSVRNPCGLTGSRIPQLERLRFCQECVGEDKSRYGECYWHRIHQISGVEICPFHQVYLQESDARTRNKISRHQFVAAEDAIRYPLLQPSNTQSPYHQILLALAHDAHFLLCQYHSSQDQSVPHHRYRKLLSEKGLATYRGRVVDTGLFLQQFRNSYPPQLLQLLHCELDEHLGQPWLLRLVRAPEAAQHPLHHLLLMHFLGYTVEDFFARSVENKPFGDGPWPCLNPICQKYHQSCIRECRIVHSRCVRGRPIGTFACTCGFAYSRTGPDTTRDSQFQRNKMKAFGPLWEAKLQLLWKDETASLQSMANQLGVAPRTVKLQAARIGLPFPRPGGMYPQSKGPKRAGLRLEQARDPTALETNRAAWLALMQAYPEAGVTILRNREPRLHSWLYRNDKMWLFAHAPLCKKPEPPSSRIDWEARDLQLAEEVRRAALLLKNLPGHPVALTVASIGREIGHLTFLRRWQERLPRTAEVLREFVETHEAFAVRRVWWAMTAFSQEQIYPKRWQLVQRAGVWNLVTRPEVKSALDTALQILQRESKV
jgi:Tn7-like transposition protein D/TniQ